MLNAKIFYIFLCLIVIETTGLLLLKRGLEMGYLDTEAIILAVFSFAFYNLCSFAWVCSTSTTLLIIVYLLTRQF
ncbi:hypothetical protein RKU97_05525 [Streptococcus pneumoniae]|nr:hypothetical protein [Streptococcus pneumoniae]